jgi:hypothetical protein
VPECPISYIFISNGFYKFSGVRKPERFLKIGMLFAGRWWLTSIILATQEAEIKKIAV